MGAFLYSMLVLFFLLPFTAITFYRIKKGATRFDNGVSGYIVNTMLSTQRWFGKARPWLFYGFHVIFLLVALDRYMFLSVITVIAYMVYYQRLWNIMQANSWGLVDAASPAAVPPPVPLSPQQQVEADQTNTRG